MDINDAEKLGSMIESCSLDASDKEYLAEYAGFWWPQFRFTATVVTDDTCDIVVGVA